MAETSIQWTQSPPLPHDVTLPRRMRVPGLNDGRALPKGHVLPAGSHVGGFTFNGWLGCNKVSPGCKFCYAEVSQTAVMRQGGKVRWGPNTDRVRTADSTWRRPLAWNRVAEELGVPLFVFAQSLSDTFEDRDDLEGWRMELFDLIWQTPNLRWLLLTKRPEVMARFAAEYGWPSNAWAGCTVEDQRRADERIPHLLRVPASVRFLSLEPLLGPVDLSSVARRGCLTRWVNRADKPWRRHGNGLQREWHGVDWLIIGGESGPYARPMHPEWARSLIRQGEEAGVAVHFKQWGAWTPVDDPSFGRGGVQRITMADDNSSFAETVAMDRVGKKAAGRVIDGRTWDEIPEVLRG